jgi:hypothetical protein
MAYETTMVAVSKSQEAIRKLILGNAGTGVAFVSQPPHEGFEAQVLIDGKTYRIRVTAECKPLVTKRKRRRWSSVPAKDPIESEQRRVWRVLFYHLKGVYEASKSGVMEFREMMLPYIVTADNRTIGERVLPHLERAISGNPERLLLPQKSSESE